MYISKYIYIYTHTRTHTHTAGIIEIRRPAPVEYSHVGQDNEMSYGECVMSNRSASVQLLWIVQLDRIEATKQRFCEGASLL